MKARKLVLVMVAVFMSIVSFGQTDSTKTDTTTTQTDTTGKDSTNANLGTGSNTLPELQSPENKPKLPAANFGRYYIPVLGTYTASEVGSDNTSSDNSTDNKSAENTSSSVTVTGDESNAGKVWVEGLTGVKFFALLKAVPGTYKIPTQKQDEKSIPEGTLLYDETSKNITICLGCGYKNPSEATADTDVSEKDTKKNSKAVINFTGVKTDQGTAQTK